MGKKSQDKIIIRVNDEDVPQLLSDYSDQQLRNQANDLVDLLQNGGHAGHSDRSLVKSIQFVLQEEVRRKLG